MCSSAGIVVTHLDHQMTSSRQRHHALLARASTATLEAAWQRFAPHVSVHVLRPPETGLVMLRGRVGGNGDPFHVGEASLTRCVVAVSLAGGISASGSEPVVGVGYVLGRDRRKAELMAGLEALARMPELADTVQAEVLAPMAEAQRKRSEQRARETEASRVAFVTMVRGET